MSISLHPVAPTFILFYSSHRCLRLIFLCSKEILYLSLSPLSSFDFSLQQGNSVFVAILVVVAVDGGFHASLRRKR
jgi:hypothetical protein